MSCEGCPQASSCSKGQKEACSLKINPHNHIKNCIAVLSGKGGVGKSTVTVLLARALARKGLKVGIMDADITGPSIPRLMDLQNGKALATADNEILPIVSEEGIECMSLNYLVEHEEDPVIWRGPIVSNVVKQFYTDVLWGELDVLLIDMPPGTGDVALTILQDLPVDGVLMVSTPQPMVSMIVAKAISMCQQMHIPVLGIVENMAYLECPNCHDRIEFYNEEDEKKFLEGHELKLYARLPMLDLIRDIHQYDSYNLAQQEKVQEFMGDMADEILDDIKNGKSEG